MPRSGRLDAPGVLHHITIRGIERRNIFRDDTDRDEFLARLARLVPETQTTCFAWALLPNHAHLLLRTGATPLPTLMRRLLTGYAVRFNHRHHRHGVLFQNRYKSVVCQEDLYFTELVRYIHLNPLRAGIVANMAELNRYAYGGHSAMLGVIKRPWHATEYALGCFGKRLPQARKAYAAYVAEGRGQGHRGDLVGGGLIRSLGGWAEVKERRGKGRGLIKSDERILGSSDFVEGILAQANEQYARRYDLTRRGLGLAHVIERVAKIYDLDPRDVGAAGRQRAKVNARSLLCFWAVRDLGLPLTTLARQLGLSPPGVSYAVQRGEAMVREKRLEFVR